MTTLEKYFEPFRKNIIGYDATFESPYGTKRIIYGDWIASGRLYGPIEKKLQSQFGPFVANTHTDATITGSVMTRAYNKSHELIKKYVNAGPNDIIITAGYGMTTVINKLMRILRLKDYSKNSEDCMKKSDRPVVFITHMEHHSNHTPWFETIADVVMIKPNDDLLVDLNDFQIKLELYKDRKLKIGSFTACSNVTGVYTPYYKLAKLMHEYGGLVFVDFAASAPYVEINMHPEDPEEKLDAIFFSPHKFLGGPGSSGVLIFNKSMYNTDVPDNPGGGTVDWSNPWGNYKYLDNIEMREDGGTPGFLQSIKAALAMQLKEQMGEANIIDRENEILKIAFAGLRSIEGIEILANKMDNRLGVISFFHPKIHFNLFVKLLNDRYGIQTRGGCACAGTYGHYLLNVSYKESRVITERINKGDLSRKPGWVRWSLHPTMTDQETNMVLHAVKQISLHYRKWLKDYVYLSKNNEFVHQSQLKYQIEIDMISNWFSK